MLDRSRKITDAARDEPVRQPVDEPDDSPSKLGTEIQLQPDLHIAVQYFQGRRCYVIEDVPRSRFYRIGEGEHCFLQHLETGHSIESAARRTRNVGYVDFDDAKAARFVGWLCANDLAAAARVGGIVSRPATTGRATFGGQRSWNPMSIRLPLFSPDAILTRAASMAGWLFHRSAVIGTGVLVLVALLVAMLRWDDLKSTSEIVIARENWYWFALSFFALKILHELGHGIVCRKYGGRVPEAGIMVAFLMPFAYVDTTSSWRFPSKWQRLHVAAAGMYVEVLIAAVATLVWAASDDGVCRYVCFQLLLSAGVMTVLCNVNPLMRFDGYYVLSDWLEIPNLYAKGRRAVNWILRRVFLGRRSSGPNIPTGTELIYGIASGVWRVVFVAGIVVMLSQWLQGAGVVFAALVAIIYFLAPAARLGRYLAFSPALEPSERRQCFTRLSIVGLCSAVVLSLPIHPRYETCGIVEFEPLWRVRAESSGFVEQVHVVPGQKVHRGDVLLTLVNRELVHELRDVELELAQSELRVRMNRRDHAAAALQSELKERESIAARLREKQTSVEQLLVRAPSDGTVLGRNLAMLQGTYVREGDELLTLGDPRQKQLRILVEQRSLRGIAHRATPVLVAIAGMPPLDCAIDRVDPEATRVPPDKSVCATFGGWLPSTVRKIDGQERISLIDPYFSSYAALDPITSQRLPGGARVRVGLRLAQVRVGSLLLERLQHWLALRRAGSDTGTN